MLSFHVDIQRIAHRNCTKAMAEVLAKELGVSADALRRLGLGYLPAVRFKKGTNYDGHWTFPELDAVGRAIGLSLRNRLDGKRKTMFPGSKHGLFYVPGSMVSSSGAGADGPRWVRVSEANVDCPICGKPDWCLVDARDPQDPAAAICPRTPSERNYGDAGYLHILDEGRSAGLATRLSPTLILPESRLPVLVVEGATDAAALIGLGFVAVGRPSATGGFTELARLLKGRDVVIVGENDLKKDGSHPGRLGAEKCERALTLQCERVRCIFPPLVHKDVRTWVVAEGLSQEALEEFLAEHSGPLRDLTKPDALPNADVDTIATAYLDEFCYQDAEPTLHHCQGSWFDYGTDGWVSRPDRDSVSNAVGRFMRRRKVVKVSKSGVELLGLNPTRNRVESVVGNLRYELAVDAGLPSWLDGSTIPDPRHVISFANGMFSIDDYLRGDDALSEHTPVLFTASRLPFAYDKTATSPLWETWLEQTLGDDHRKIYLLQEWFGYNLLPDNQFEKMLMLIGLPGSGKGTALSVLHNLLGRNVEALNLRSLSRQFGLANLPGKLAVIFGDAIPPNSNREAVIQMLLEIVGGDKVPVEEKYKTGETVQLHCRVTLASNNMPELPSENEAMARRLMYIRFNEDFKPAPDTTLKTRLRDEMPGIMSWALLGLARLYQTGSFTVTAGQAEEERTFRNVTNPLGEFMEKWIIRDPNSRVTATALYEAYRLYCESRGLKLRSASYLFDRLQGLYQVLRRETILDGGRNIEYITGIDLQPWGRGHESERKQA